MTRVLIIEDDKSFGQRLARNLGLDSLEAELAEGGLQGLKALKSENFDAVVCDIKMPGLDGLEVLSRVRKGAEPGIDPEIPFLVLTSVTDVETAVEAMRLGASDYLTKECGRSEIVMRLRRALENRALADENVRLKETLARADEFSEMIGSSPEMQAIKDEVQEVAPTSAPVMILGETGAGKELVARALHRASGRSGPFVDLNAALIPDDNFFQSELFGHERGAFTNANQMKRGKLEIADGGTFFLDEIGEVSPPVQAKLLRVLETMSFTRMGGTKTIKVDVRLIVATNRDLKKEMDAGRFRRDLYYRLNVFPMEVPPLRQRREDIPELTRHFLDRFAEKYARPRAEIRDDALQLLLDYDWPGNIRELRNVCERLVIRTRTTGEITPADVQSCGIQPPSRPDSIIEIPPEGIDLADVERQLVIEALETSDWNQTEAARLLNISVDRMNNRVKKYGLTHPSWRVNR